MVTRLLIRTVQNVDWGRPRPWAPADLLGTAPADLLRFFLLPGMPLPSPKRTKMLEGTETKGGAKKKW